MVNEELYAEIRAETAKAHEKGITLKVSPALLRALGEGCAALRKGDERDLAIETTVCQELQDQIGASYCGFDFHIL